MNIFFYSAIIIENVLVHHILIARTMFSYSLDDPETKRIKVQPHSKKKLAVSFLIVSSTCRWPEIKVLLVAVFFFSWQPTLDDKAACVSFSLCWLCPDFLFLTATQKTLA